MSNSLPGVVFTCVTCGARWSSGVWTWGCVECSGGAMELPCGLCLGTCGGSFKRAPMDSNDSGRAHFFGQCLDPRPLSEKALQVQQFLTAVRRALPHEAALRRELTSWSSDASWNAEPRGPHALQVVLDALAEQGLVVSPRVLAHAVFDREDAGD